jgi:hypothetical protein
VGEERDLGQHDAERRRDEQLEPALAEQDETGDAPGEAEGQRRADERRRPEPGAAVRSSFTTCDTWVYERATGGNVSDVAYVCRIGPRVDAG